MSAPAQATLWDYVPPVNDEQLQSQLVTIALELARANHLYGVTVGEIVFEAERRGIKVGGVPMDDKIREQRQTSWLPRVMKAAGLSATDRVRQSPVRRHHKHRHSVWVLPDSLPASPFHPKGDNQ